MEALWIRWSLAHVSSQVSEVWLWCCRAALKAGDAVGAEKYLSLMGF